MQSCRVPTLSHLGGLAILGFELRCKPCRAKTKTAMSLRRMQPPNTTACRAAIIAPLSVNTLQHTSPVGREQLLGLAGLL
jgi:hypothetical protein